MAEQDFSEIAKLSERFSKDPKSRIFVQLADAYRKSNMVDEALEVLKQGLQYHPQYPLAHLIQGRCYFDKRLYAQAKESFDRVIKFDPQNIIALRMIAQVCETLRDEAGQIEAYKGLLAVDPTDTKAQEKLTALEAIQKKQSFFTITMAQEYERQGNLSEALKIYENLGFSDPSDLGIQEKIRELKQKLSSSGKVDAPAAAKHEEKIEGLEQFESYTKPKHEEKVEGLEQFESYTKHHEVDFNAATQTPPVEKTETPEVKSDIPLAGIVEKTLETAPVEAAPAKGTEKTSAADLGTSDFVSSVTDFMLQEKPAAPPQIESVEMKKEEPAIAEPEKASAPPLDEIPPEPVTEITALSDLLVAEEKPTKAEEAPVEIPPVKAEEEVLSISDLLTEEPPATLITEHSPSETVTVSPVEPEPAKTPIVEPAAPPQDEIMSLSDLIETPPAAAEPAAPSAAAEPMEMKPVETEPDLTAPAAAAGETAKPPETEPTPTTAEPKPESAEEPKKQKEEDFKSFQDWLSGLLK